MNRYFKAVNGVVDVVSFEPETGADWVATQEHVFAGFLWDGEALTPPLPPPKYSDADAAKSAMVDWINGFTTTITGSIPIDEKLSWSIKENAARSYVAGAADTQQAFIIDSEASITGEVPTALAETIIAKADKFKAVSAFISGLRRKTITEIDNAANASDYETILKNANDEAIRLAQSLGVA